MKSRKLVGSNGDSEGEYHQCGQHQQEQQEQQNVFTVGKDGEEISPLMPNDL
jgi:hypothetical protein